MGSLIARTQVLPAGGGAFRLETLTVGVFLSNQPTHRLAIGSDRRQVIPIAPRQGWVFAGGTEGICEYDATLDLVTVSLDNALLTEAGADTATELRMVGTLDPLVVHMALAAEGFGAGGRLYRETMSRALAAQLVMSMAHPVARHAALDDRRLRRAVEHIHDHLGEDLSLESLSASAGMSPFHFARSFKAAIGASPLQYVIRKRIETAQGLLKSTRLSIAEIAHRVGYDDVGRFGQHFKRQIGATPGAFRAR